MQPVSLEAREGSGSGEPFASVEPSSACFRCGLRPVPRLCWEVKGGSWGLSAAVFSVSVPHFPREAR